MKLCVKYASMHGGFSQRHAVALIVILHCNAGTFAKIAPAHYLTHIQKPAILYKTSAVSSSRIAAACSFIVNIMVIAICSYIICKRFAFTVQLFIVAQYRLSESFSCGCQLFSLKQQ